MSERTLLDPDSKKPAGVRFVFFTLLVLTAFVVVMTAYVAGNSTWTHAAAYFGERDHSQYTMEWDTCKIYWVGKSFSIAAIDEAAEFHRACREAH